MGWTRERIERFLEEYLDTGDSPDSERIRGACNDPFMFCDPSGARSVPVDALIAALPKRRAFFDAVGHQSVELASFEDVALDDRYVLVKAKLRMLFQVGDAPAKAAVLDSTYVLYDDGEQPRIVLHLESEDAGAVLRASGILPAE
jgi:hypothetical protein